MRRLAVLLLWVASLPVALAAAGGADLSGTWTSPVPSTHGGTTIQVTQTGTTITWTGGPNDKAWVQEYTGTLSGSTFSGEFQQDAPGVTPQRYHGSISGVVRSPCRLDLTSVEQAGQVTLTDVPFFKAGCEAKPVPVRFSVRARLVHYSQGKVSFFAVLTGSGRLLAKQPDGNGDAAIFEVATSELRLRIGAGGGPAKDVELRVRPGGSYRAREHAASLHVEVVDSDSPSCPRNAHGTLTLRRPAGAELAGVCRGSASALYWAGSEHVALSLG